MWILTKFQETDWTYSSSEPDSCMTKDLSPGFHLATYLDSDSDEDILNVGQNINVWHCMVKLLWSSHAEQYQREKTVKTFRS